MTNDKLTVLSSFSALRAEELLNDCPVEAQKDSEKGRVTRVPEYKRCHPTITRGYMVQLGGEEGKGQRVQHTHTSKLL